MLKSKPIPMVMKNTLKGLRATKNFLQHLLLRESTSHKTNPTFDDLIEVIPDSDLPELDRQTPTTNQLTPEQKTWRENGYLILPRFIPDDLLNPYIRVREKIAFSGGYKTPIPYMDVEEIKDLCLYKPLMDKLELLIGEPMGMHLNLTGWVSTERNWHQDDYLSPSYVNGWYLAVWVALDDIHPDAGPFEFLPGTHKWPLIRGDKVREFLPVEERNQPSWPKTSEVFLSNILEERIRRESLAPQQFIAKKGDVLIWHARLLHRGPEPKNASLERRAIITHYSSIYRRADMPKAVLHQSYGYYFPISKTLQHDDKPFSKDELTIKPLHPPIGS